ncbi:MAG: tetratricopeptide repeat protein [Alphaproteobacteria bacterium]|nr:tetratricopeptide repeat protein [Alphaproteobacteria bacterium]MCW5741960.1 tetratricopeptide repeat protein [Alphaproteobacteria bacterium]
MTDRLGRLTAAAVVLAVASGAAVWSWLEWRGPTAPANAQSQATPSTKAGDQEARPRVRRDQSVEGLFLAGRAAEARRDHETALAMAEAALSRVPDDPEIFTMAFRQRILGGRLAVAAELAPKMLARKSDDGFANLVLALPLIKRGDFKGAEAYFEQLGDRTSSGILRPFSEAWLKAGQQDFVAARERLATVKPGDDDPFMPAWRTHAALIDEAAGDKQAAEDGLRAATRGEVPALRPVLTLAAFLRRNGKADEAREILRKFADANPEAVLMDALIASTDTPKAPTPADMIGETLFDLGALLAGSGGVIGGQRVEGVEERVLMFMRLALELNPNLDTARLVVADVYESFAAPRKAIEMLKAVPKASPLHWRARLRASLAMVEADRIDEAVKALQAMVDERTERIDAAWTLGDLLRSKERYADAAVVFDVAISRVATPGPRHAALWFGRGMCRERTKNWPGAEADLKRALELMPEQPYVLNYLGYTWIDRGENLEEGMALLQRALKQRPDDGAITDSVGWAYYRMGKYDLAVEYLERAIQLKADDATIVDHLGDAYWHVGRRREARFQWERALAGKPEPDRIDIIRRKLNEGLTAELDQPIVGPGANEPAKTPDPPAEKK